MDNRGQAGQQRSGRTAEIRQDSRCSVGLQRPTWQAEAKDDHERLGRAAEVRQAVQDSTVDVYDRTAEVMQDSRGLVGLERPTWQVEQVRMDSRGQTGQQSRAMDSRKIMEAGLQRSCFRSYIYIDRVGL
jgi:hypothetical protein